MGSRRVDWGGGGRRGNPGVKSERLQALGSGDLDSSVGSEHVKSGQIGDIFGGRSNLMNLLMD